VVTTERICNLQPQHGSCQRTFTAQSRLRRQSLPCSFNRLIVQKRLELLTLKFYALLKNPDNILETTGPFS
jgi:hypothetical protein